MNYKGYTIFEDGTILGKRGNKITAKLHKKYLHVFIDKQAVPIHRLVATAYVPNPENKKEIHHLDGNRYNNKADNLVWVTRAEHQQYHKDEINVRSKLDWNKVDYIRANLHKSTNNLARELNVTAAAISLVKHNKSWKPSRHP